MCEYVYSSHFPNGRWEVGGAFRVSPKSQLPHPTVRSGCASSMYGLIRIIPTVWSSTAIMVLQPATRCDALNLIRFTSLSVVIRGTLASIPAFNHLRNSRISCFLSNPHARTQYTIQTAKAEKENKKMKRKKDEVEGELGSPCAAGNHGVTKR